MPVNLRGAFTVGVDRPTVWAKLHDPHFLQGCMRECEALRRIGDTRYLGAARVRLGPVSVLFSGQIVLRDLDPPRAWRMVVTGMGGLAGHASGSAHVELWDVPQGTAVAYALEANFGGRIARFGSRLIDAAAQRVAERFSANVSAALLAAGPV